MFGSLDTVWEIKTSKDFRAWNIAYFYDRREWHGGDAVKSPDNLGIWNEAASVLHVLAHDDSLVNAE